MNLRIFPHIEKLAEGRAVTTLRGRILYVGLKRRVTTLWNRIRKSRAKDRFKNYMQICEGGFVRATSSDFGPRWGLARFHDNPPL